MLSPNIVLPVYRPYFTFADLVLLVSQVLLSPLAASGIRPKPTAKFGNKNEKEKLNGTIKCNTAIDFTYGSHRAAACSRVA